MARFSGNSLAHVEFYRDPGSRSPGSAVAAPVSTGPGVSLRESGGGRRVCMAGVSSCRGRPPRPLCLTAPSSPAAAALVLGVMGSRFLARGVGVPSLRQRSGALGDSFR